MVDDIVDLLCVTFQDGRHLLRILVEHHSISVSSSYKETKWFEIGGCCVDTYFIHVHVRVWS